MASAVQRARHEQRRVASIGYGFATAPPAVGGEALLTGEADGFATDFTYATDASRVAVKTASITTSYALDAFYANAGTSPKQVFDVSGTLVWSPHNMFLNSAAPATQNVTTVVGQNYTVTVVGSGSMTGSAGASGVATAGAPLTYVATTATSTFTLAGSLTRIQMNRGAVATAYIATPAAIKNGLAIDYDPVTHAALGLLCEPAATNLILNNAAMSTQNCTVTAAAHTLSFWGTGTITLSGVSTAGPLVGTGANDRVSLTFTPTAGSLTCTVSGTVTRAQLELGIIATSSIPTFAATATRAVDNVNCLTSTFPWSAAGANSILVTAAALMVPGTGAQLVLHDGTDNERHTIDTQSGTKKARLISLDGNVTQCDISPVGAPVAGTYYKAGAALAVNDFALVVDGGAASTDVAGTLATVTTLTVGGIRAVPGLNMRIKTLMIVPRRMTNVELQTKTA